MVKSIIKEIIVILLLLLAITLALGVLFYDYIPSNKAVPSIETYSTSESIQTELDEQIKDDEAVLVTYEITSGDLKNYEKTNQYEKGKANPFAPYEKDAPEGNNTNDKNNVTNTTVKGNTTKGNTFYKNTGTK
ncbi:MAG: hypothetical protein HFJ54_03920 [Clostridia bacterium]|nr:hypothetical protein [Clostridia bacterium]